MTEKFRQLFIDSGAYRWGDYKATPYTIGGVRPSYRLGARKSSDHHEACKSNHKRIIVCIDSPPVRNE